MTHILGLILTWALRGVIVAAVLTGAAVILGEIAAALRDEIRRRRRARAYAAAGQQWDQHVTEAIAQAAELVPYEPGGRADWQLWESEYRYGGRRG